MFQWNWIQPFLNISNNKNRLKSFFFKLFGEKRLVKSVKGLPSGIKPINPIQKYPHITESYPCFLKIFVVIVDLLIKLFISFRMCSTPKLSN